MFSGLWQEFWIKPWSSKFTVPLIIINVLGSIYGYYWYHMQLAATPAVYRIFVPDSPFATTLFALALFLYFLGWRSSLFGVVAMTASIKYGIWAVLLISHLWLHGGAVRPTEVILFVSHLGMVAQGLIFLRNINWGGFTVLTAFGWMLLNDFMDYIIGLHPYLFVEGQLFFASLSAVGLTLIISLGLVLGRRRLIF